MKIRSIGACTSTLILAACASQTDRFYDLSVLPSGVRTATTPTTSILLDVTVPAVVDRFEMVINTPNNGVDVINHERWAAPLSDNITDTLARDLEQRRVDVVVADRRFVKATTQPTSIKVDVVRATVYRGGKATLEAHWRILAEAIGIDRIGAGSFDADVAGKDYAAVARAYSECVSALADRIAADLPPGAPMTAPPLHP